MSNGVEVEDTEESPGFPPVAVETNSSAGLVESPELSQDGVYRGGLLRLQIPPPTTARAPVLMNAMTVPHSSGNSIGVGGVCGVASDDMSMSSLASACLSPASSTASTGAASSVTSATATAQHYHAMMAGMTPLRPHFLPVHGYPGMESEFPYFLDVG